MVSTGIKVPHDPRGTLARQRVIHLDEQLQAFWKQSNEGVLPHKASIALSAAAKSQQMGIRIPLLSIIQTTALALEAALARLATATARIPDDASAQKSTPTSSPKKFLA